MADEIVGRPKAVGRTTPYDPERLQPRPTPREAGVWNGNCSAHAAGREGCMRRGDEACKQEETRRGLAGWDSTHDE